MYVLRPTAHFQRRLRVFLRQHRSFADQVDRTLRDLKEEAAVARVKASLEDVAAGRVRTMSVEEIMG